MVGGKIKGRLSNLNHTYFFSWPNVYNFFFEQ